MRTENDRVNPQRDALGVLVTLALIAGYVDACIFLAFAGFFVAQVTGSYVVAGSELFSDNANFGAKVLAIPVFIASGMVATAIVRAAGPRRDVAMVATFGLEAALLFGLTIASFREAAGPIMAGTALLGLAAMGIQSAAVRLLLPGSPSTNVMTSNTTQLAIELVDSISAHKPTAKLLQTGSVILGFSMGIAAGAFAYRAAGLACLCLAAVVLCVVAVREIAVVTAKSRPHTRSL